MAVAVDGGFIPRTVGEERYFVATYGCRVNQADSAGVAAELERGGLVRTKDAREAHLVVLNTCTVIITLAPGASRRRRATALRTSASERWVTVQ
ncbi:MAG: hypothetical protein AAFU79_11905, partial [Myxococcota bacterium]